MKQSKKINQLKLNATEIKNKQQLHEIKGGNGGITESDYRARIIGTSDYREVVGNDDFRDL